MKGFVLFGALSASICAQAESVRPASPLTALRFEDLSATRERPLFSSSRRPRVPTAEPTGTATSSPAPIVSVQPTPAIDMIGAVIGTSRSFVLLRETVSGHYIRAHTGDIIDGWTVQAITLWNVTMMRSESLVIIRLGSTETSAKENLSSLNIPLEKHEIFRGKNYTAASSKLYIKPPGVEKQEVPIPQMLR